MKSTAFASAADVSGRTVRETSSQTPSKSRRSIRGSLRAAVAAVGRAIVVIFDGFVEGHRLQAQVLSQRGRSFLQD
jgi:hypothetical protein